MAGLTIQPGSHREHMPFLLTLNDRTAVLQSVADHDVVVAENGGEVKYSRWRIAWSQQTANWPALPKLELRCDPFSVQCCPTFYQEGGWNYISYIEASWDEKGQIKHRLMLAKGYGSHPISDISPVAEAPPCVAGFVSERNIAYLSDKHTAVLLDKRTYAKTEFNTELAVRQLSYVFDAPQILIVSGTLNGHDHSIAINTADLSSREILDRKGDRVYKCSMLAGGLAYTLADSKDRSAIHFCPVTLAPCKIKWSVGNAPLDLDPWEKIKKSWADATGFITSMISRGGPLNRKVSLEVKQERWISCHGDNQMDLPHCEKRRYDAQGNFYYCGACPCGAKDIARLSKRGVQDGQPVPDPQYDKLDYPYLLCPLEQPGFSNAKEGASWLKPQAQPKNSQP